MLIKQGPDCPGTWVHQAQQDWKLHALTLTCTIFLWTNWTVHAMKGVAPLKFLSIHVCNLSSQFWWLVFGLGDRVFMVVTDLAYRFPCWEPTVNCVLGGRGFTTLSPWMPLDTNPAKMFRAWPTWPDIKAERTEGQGYEHSGSDVASPVRMAPVFVTTSFVRSDSDAVLDRISVLGFWSC